MELSNQNLKEHMLVKLAFLYGPDSYLIQELIEDELLDELPATTTK